MRHEETCGSGTEGHILVGVVVTVGPDDLSGLCQPQ